MTTTLVMLMMLTNQLGSNHSSRILSLNGRYVRPDARGHETPTLPRRNLGPNHVVQLLPSSAPSWPRNTTPSGQASKWTASYPQPAVVHPAPPHGKYVSNAYATVYRMLEHVTGSVPVTTVDLEKGVADEEWLARKPYPRIIAEGRFPYDWGDKEMQELYKEGGGGPVMYENSPVGVQFVCRRLQEEKMVGILKEVERLLLI